MAVWFTHSLSLEFLNTKWDRYVATCFRSGGMSKHNFIANLSLSFKVNKIENWLILEVTCRSVYAVSIVVPLYPDTRCSLAYAYPRD